MDNLRTSFIARLDWLTVGLYLGMVIFGWMNIYATTYGEPGSGSLFNFGSQYSKQFYFILTAFLIAILVLTIESKFWAFFSYPIFVLGLLVLLLTMLFGQVINGAKAWIFIGPLSLQPAEFAKFATALAIAKILSRFNFQFTRLRDLLILGVVTALPIALIILQKDTGTALVYLAFVFVFFREGLSWLVLMIGGLAILLFLLTLVMPLTTLLPLVSLAGLILAWVFQRRFRFFLWGTLMLASLFGLAIWIGQYSGKSLTVTQLFFIASMVAFLIWLVIIIRKRYQALLVLLFTWLGALIFIFSVDVVFHEILKPHQQARINQTLGLEHDPLGTGYNLNQSKIAIGSGGFFGKGFMKGTQTRFKFVPEQSTDFIFCTIGEEWGFLGSLVVIGLFVSLLLRMIFLAERQRSVFSRVYGYGAASVIFFHFFVNIGMTTGMVPVIGIPLPFFSYGGSSLWAFTLLLFIFLRLDTDRTQVIA
ncbi:MAG: rod shape-determining protein RodA [Bacteroidales bacterium]